MGPQPSTPQDEIAPYIEAINKTAAREARLAAALDEIVKACEATNTDVYVYKVASKALQENAESPHKHVQRQYKQDRAVPRLW